MKTVSVALVLCLNIGVEPPDVPRPPQGKPRKHAWVEPILCSPQKSSQKIADFLQAAYVNLQPKARRVELLFQLILSLKFQVQDRD
jgi:regulator-associated protein of mTOR